MAKIAFSKLNAKVNTDIKSIEVGEDKIIEVRQYLPVSDKLTMIGKIIEFAHDPDINYANTLKTEVYLVIEILDAYTNITFTEKQKEDPAKLYDMLMGADWFNSVWEAIPVEEVMTIRTNLARTQIAIYDYRSSILGILDTIQTDYSDLDLNITELQQKLANGENIELVKNIMSQLG